MYLINASFQLYRYSHIFEDRNMQHSLAAVVIQSLLLVCFCLLTVISYMYIYHLSTALLFPYSYTLTSGCR